jgi:hypothetical protein
MQVPNVGSKVIVKLSYSQGRAMIPPQPTERTYEGVVLNPLKWVTDQEFCLSGTKDFPVRVINMSSVLDIKLIKGDFKNVDTDHKVWTVKGSKGNSYTVTRMSNKYNCTCPGFSFRKTCKHVVEVK